MRSVQFRRYGGPEVLEVADVEVPHAGPGEIRVETYASSLGPGEMTIRAGRVGLDAELAAPYRTGYDAAGVVDEVGDGVTGVAVGDEVFGLGPSAGSGSNSDYAVLSTWAPKPAGWSWAEATTAGGAAETATRVLDRLADAGRGVLVVNGASGVVGTVATQLARARGYTVVGTAGAANLDHVASLGAIPVVYGDGVIDRIRAAAPSGVDGVFDAAGSGLADLVELVGDPSRVVTIADPGAARLGVHLSHGAGPAQAAALGVPVDPPAWHGLQAAAALADDGGLVVPVAATFPLEEVVAAARALEAPRSRGKVVLIHRSDD